jgi:hypothetical protein
MATSFMTLAIQRAEHRDIQALQARRGSGGAHYASPEATKGPRDRRDRTCVYAPGRVCTTTMQRAPVVIGGGDKRSNPRLRRPLVNDQNTFLCLAPWSTPFPGIACSLARRAKRGSRAAWPMA